MSTIKDLEPKELWNNFYSLTQCPRPSKHEEIVRAMLVDFAEKNNIEHEVDAIGNIIMRKPATPGMENRRGVILQAHVDMVPQKNNDKVHDFIKDPITTVIKEDWVWADGTTLGADNGIGAAAAMTVLASKTLQHGPVEALFTIDEETGMTGAENLKEGIMKGDLLLEILHLLKRQSIFLIQRGLKLDHLALLTFKSIDRGLKLRLLSFELTSLSLKRVYLRLRRGVGKGRGEQYGTDRKHEQQRQKPA